jgi:hypothetical protein
MPVGPVRSRRDPQEPLPKSLFAFWPERAALGKESQSTPTSGLAQGRVAAPNSRLFGMAQVGSELKELKEETMDRREFIAAAGTVAAAAPKMKVSARKTACLTEATRRSCLCRGSPQFFLHPTWGKTFRALCQGNDNRAIPRFAQDSTLIQVAKRD